MNSSKVATASTVIGAAGSVALTLYTGRHNGSWLLGVLFTGWVSAPFVILGAAHSRAARWSPTARAAIQVLAPLIAVGSIGVYTYFTLHPRAKTPAAPFVATPIVAVLATVIVVAAAELAARAGARRRRLNAR